MTKNQTYLCRFRVSRAVWTDLGESNTKNSKSEYFKFSPNGCPGPSQSVSQSVSHSTLTLQGVLSKRHVEWGQGSGSLEMTRRCHIIGYVRRWCILDFPFPLNGSHMLREFLYRRYLTCWSRWSPRNGTISFRLVSVGFGFQILGRNIPRMPNLYKKKKIFTPTFYNYYEYLLSLILDLSELS